MHLRQSIQSLAIASAFLAATPLAGHAEQIAVSNYASSVSGMPWTIALKKGFFKEHGLPIDNVISSAGGSGDIRNLIAGDLPYSDSGLVSFVAGIKSGAPLKIINENGHSTAQFLWIVANDSKLKDWHDLKGLKITYTTPLSISQALDNMLIAKAGFKPDEVKTISMGAYGSALTALQHHAVDISIVAEPVYTLNKANFRPLAWSRDVFPAISNTLGVTSAKTAKDRPELLRGLLLAHREAVDFMKTNRKEASAIIGADYKMEPAIVEQVLEQIMDHPSIDGVPFFSEGDLDAKGIDALLVASQAPGDTGPAFAWRDYVDQSFLPADLRRDLK